MHTPLIKRGGKKGRGFESEQDGDTWLEALREEREGENDMIII